MTGYLARPLTILAFAALLIPVQPARADVFDAVGGYCYDRVLDFADIFRIRAGIPGDGEGFGLKARATALAQIGYVHFDGGYAGWDRRGFGVAWEERTEGGVSLLYGSRHDMKPRIGTYHFMGDTLWSEVRDRHILRTLPYWDDGHGDLLGIGGEVATPFIAVDLGLYPTEIGDFVFGFFTFDPMLDDESNLVEDWQYHGMIPTKLPGPDLEAATAKKRAELEELYGQMLSEEELDQQALEAGMEGVEEMDEEGMLPAGEESPGGMEAEPLSMQDLEEFESEADIVELPPAVDSGEMMEESGGGVEALPVVSEPPPVEEEAEEATDTPEEPAEEETPDISEY